MLFEFSMFSTWIFIWFLFYYLKIVPFNPIIFLIFAFIIGVSLGLHYFIKEKIDVDIIYKYVMINFMGKIVPVILIFNDPIKIYDILFGFGLMIVFLLFTIINKIEILNEYYYYFDSMIGRNNKIYITNIMYDYINKK
jgi:hypothetical protein